MAEIEPYIFYRNEKLQIKIRRDAHSSTLFGWGGGEGWTVRCFVPLMHFCIVKYQSVPRLLTMHAADCRFTESFVYGLTLL